MALTVNRSAILLMLVAQFYVSSAYKRWSQVRASTMLSGAEAAQRLVRMAGLAEVRIEPVAGNLTDHYDPRQKVLRLSQGVAQNRSVASLGIVAHEVGHAMQDATNYGPLRLRAGLVPMVSIGSWLGPIVFFIGLLLSRATQSTTIAWVGLFLFAGTVVFALITLKDAQGQPIPAWKAITCSPCPPAPSSRPWN